MRWRKPGRVYAPDGGKPWMRTHAANPIAEHVERQKVVNISTSARGGCLPDGPPVP